MTFSRIQQRKFGPQGEFGFFSSYFLGSMVGISVKRLLRGYISKEK